MRETPNPDVLPPDITFKDRYSVRLGKGRWDLYYLGPSHDNCLIVMIPRPYPILYVVDVLNPPYGYAMPWNPLLPDDHIYNFIPFFKSLDALAKREGITQITGGHLSVMRNDAGKPVAAPALGPATAIADRLRFWEGGPRRRGGGMEQGHLLGSDTRQNGSQSILRRARL